MDERPPEGPVEIWTMGELLAEIMRPGPDQPLHRPGAFRGPYPSGAPGILVDAVARLGHRAGIVSGVGDDPFGRLILERLRADGVRTDHVTVFPGRSTGVAFVAYAGDGSRGYVFHWDGTPAVLAPVPPGDIMPGTRFFHVMGCSLMASDAFRERLTETAERFAGAGAAITFDPNIRVELAGAARIGAIVEPILRRASILFPGAAELRFLAGEDGLDTAAAVLMERYPIEAIVLKLGSAGCRVYADGRAASLGAFPVAEVDPTGAGDAFDAGYLCARLEGRPHVEAARFAAAVGALAAGAFGPMEGDISREAVEALLRRG
jgi:sugar/nucleoside kinase (ribokinase family)